MNVIISLFLTPQAPLVAYLSAYFICVLILLDGAQRNESQSHAFRILRMAHGHLLLLGPVAGLMVHVLLRTAAPMVQVSISCSCLHCGSDNEVGTPESLRTAFPQCSACRDNPKIKPHETGKSIQ